MAGFDFHYYGTILAALEAGWHIEIAKDLGLYSCLVDEAEGKRVHEFTTFKDGKLRVMRTVHEALNDGDHSFIKAHSESTWSAFHFLPGNFDTHSFDYTEVDGYRIFKMRDFRKDDHAIKSFKLICDCRNSLSLKMMNHTIRAFLPKVLSSRISSLPRDVKISDLAIALLGVRLHVLADTYAHRGFTGSNRQYLNSYQDGSFQYRENQNNWKKQSIEGNDYLFSKDYANYLKRNVILKVSGEATSFGHGKLGNLPDRPSVFYKYKRFGDGKEIIRHNPSLFAACYDEMVFWLKKAKNAFEGNGFTDLAPYEDSSNNYSQGLIEDHSKPPIPRLGKIPAATQYGKKLFDFCEANGQYKCGEKDCHKREESFHRMENWQKFIRTTTGANLDLYSKINNNNLETLGRKLWIDAPNTLMKDSKLLYFSEAARLHHQFFLKEMEAIYLKDHTILRLGTPWRSLDNLEIKLK